MFGWSKDRYILYRRVKKESTKCEQGEKTDCVGSFKKVEIGELKSEFSILRYLIESRGRL